MAEEGEPSTTTVSDQIQSAKSLADKETLQRHQTLTQSKGRAQITATTAMSIVNVALLKSVIDRGPEDNRYYIVSLTLISVSLGLQVIAGIMSLLIEQALGYLTKYTKNVCEDLKENCCHWRCVRNPRYYGDRPGRRGNASADDIELAPLSGLGNQGGKEPWEVTIGNHREYAMPMSNSDEPICGCLPTTCTTNVYEKDEADVIHRYYLWKSRFMEDELRMVRAREELDNHLEIIEDANKSLVALNEKLKTPDTDHNDIGEKIQALKKTIIEAEEQKKPHEETVKKVEINKNQGKILKEYADAIQRNRILHLAAFWQHILNYLFYGVFILNAFIVGFGLDSKSS